MLDLDYRLQLFNLISIIHKQNIINYYMYQISLHMYNKQAHKIYFIKI